MQKPILYLETSSDDSVCFFFCGNREEEKRLEETDSQIREKESMLLKVRETLQGYHHMR